MPHNINMEESPVSPDGIIDWKAASIASGRYRVEDHGSKAFGEEIEVLGARCRNVVGRGRLPDGTQLLVGEPTSNYGHDVLGRRRAGTIRPIGPKKRERRIKSL